MSNPDIEINENQFMKIINNGLVHIKCKHFQLNCNKTNICEDYCHCHDTPTPPDTEGSDNNGTFNGHTYAVFKGTTADFDDWQAECVARGGYLAIIESAEENTFIFNLIKNLGYNCAYFGLYTTDHKTWYWVDGRTLDEVGYKNWR